MALSRIPGRAFVATLLSANVVLLVVIPVLLGVSFANPRWIVVENLAMAIPTLVCLRYAFARGPRRGAAVMLTLAMLSQAAGNVIYSAWTQYQAHPPVPSPSDAAYLGFYVSVAGAVLWLARSESGSLPRALWLDGAIGAAGAAAALAAGLSLLRGAQGDSAAVIVGGAYTVADLLLVAMIAGLLTVRGVRGGSIWVWLAAGMAAFCAADVVYAVRVDAGNYAIGPWLHVLWMTGITSIAVSIRSPQRSHEGAVARSRTMLVIPMLATLVSLGILALFGFAENPVVMSLATVTLLLAIARTFVSFRQARGLADARRQAVTDDLTRLGNRRALFEHGSERLASVDGSERLVLILIDLDNFKEINDTFGHPAGDRLLREIGRRLALGASQHDLLVRLGGDEFAVLTAPAAADDVHDLATEVLDRITEPLILDGARVLVAASAGVAECVGEAGMSDLLRRADVALYAAKDTHARVAIYDPELDRLNRQRLRTIQELDHALTHDQLVLHYQPKVQIATGAAFRAEALVRWQHPTRGLLQPDAFLPIAEQSGLIHALTWVVLQAAARQLVAWRGDGLEISIAVNLSASDLLDDSLADRIGSLLDEHSLPPGALELEITESVLMLDLERALTLLDALRRLGVRIAIDDYGTGYSTLAYLRDLPVDDLKLDRSFAGGVTTDPRSAAIVRSTIDLAHALGLQVTAEGVEDHATLVALARKGCDYAQGYYFSRPVPAAAFAAAVRSGAFQPAHAFPIAS